MPPKRRRAAAAVKIEPVGSATVATKKARVAKSVSDEELKEIFMSLFSEEKYAEGISNTELKDKFGKEILGRLVPIINELSQESRLIMSKSEGSGETDLFYKLVSEEFASKFAGLEPNARLV